MYHHLPLPGGQSCQTRDEGSGAGLYLPARLPRVRLRQQAEGQNHHEQADHAVRRGIGEQSQSPFREIEDL